MPAQSLLTATLEQGLNRLLALDPDSADRLAKLHGYRLLVFLEPFRRGLALAFSDKVDVLALEHEHSATVARLGSNECCIKTRLDVLGELSQTSQLTRLIQQGALQVDGELQIAQHASNLFQSLDIDWEEQLSRYTGDVVAHQTFALAAHAKESLLGVLDRINAGVGNALVEEKTLAAHRLAVMHFSDEVDRLRDDVERLDARFSQLQKQLKNT
ncbi:hypothetical protein DXV75_15165 [Alteromonas aestuariivivens]|uniref:Ubiquinone biosynthesis accessory factor UbiJ n=1 Tax=Alteromonas aestuariivivens TaxID=1938339 RepID=A0A3D8M3G6_9ALTE|nr:SCP2 sterol-binding domain-containing protein [Alteromonas aestuariivivens]RDV24166.1 hypothetical protein DXV75_15165 [Alteromonas aestuariivivens]